MALTKIKTSNIINDGNLGRRNIIINGAMQVAQRGTSETAVTGLGYRKGPDRFRRSGNNYDNFEVTRERLDNDAPEGFLYSLKETVTTVSDETDSAWAWRPVNYRIEGQDLQHLQFGTSNAKSFTLSFYVKSNKTGTASVVIYSYASDGSSRTNTRRFTINAANTWERKILNFDGDTTTAIRNNTNIGFEILLYAAAGTSWTLNDNTSWGVGETNSAWRNCDIDLNNVNDFISFTGFQLEVGDTATPFEHRSFGEELQLCKRYFCKSYSHGDAPGTNTQNGTVYSRLNDAVSNRPVSVSFPVEMRTQPTVTLYSIIGTSGSVSDCGTSYGHSSNDVANLGVGGTGATGFGAVSSINADAGDIIGMHWTAESEL